MGALGWMTRTALATGVLGLVGSGCDPRQGEGAGDSPIELRSTSNVPPFPWRAPVPWQRVPAPLPQAHCQIDVDGIGPVDLETEYLPSVIHCENGGADLESLKAQAIAARSVAYYAIETSGSICDSQACQVYSCDKEPSELAIQAARETQGMYLSFGNILTYGFYVAGDDAVDGPDCAGDASVGTERWVTYNEGREGTDVEQTELGYVHQPDEPGYGQNRGCLSQWGSRCLERQRGYTATDILRFYYGDDIELVHAVGPCVESSGTSAGEDSGTSAEPTPGDGSSGGAPDDDGSTPGSTGLSGTSDSSGAGGAWGPGGTAGSNPDGGGALPRDYGRHGPTSGCACASSASAKSPWVRGWALVAFFVLLGRRRARGPSSARAQFGRD